MKIGIEDFCCPFTEVKLRVHYLSTQTTTLVGESCCGAHCCWIHHQHVYFDINDHLDHIYIHELSSYEKTTVEGNYSVNNQIDGAH